MAEPDRKSLEQYVVSHLQEALDGGWVRTFYQPIIRTITGNFAGAEALARWNDPVYGCIMPDVVVPALEKAGLIYRLDCYMLCEVLKLQRMRREKGLSVGPVTVNLSRMDFDSIDMVSFIREQSDRFGVSRDLIGLEITESILVQNKRRMTGVVKELRNAGFQIWMDDFGSGYSSLTFLNDYRLDVIKFDMAFLRSFSRTSREIVRSTVGMAKRLGIRTLAEGVEREEHVRFLQEIGCDMMQGWYFGKPLSENAMENYVHSMKENNRAETIEWRRYYDMADACVVDTDVPLAVIEYRSGQYHYLFANKKQKEQLHTLGRKTLEESEFVLNNPRSPLRRKLKEFVREQIDSRAVSTAYFSDNSSFARLEGRMIARKKDHFLFLASLVNITDDRNCRDGLALNKAVANIDLLFDDVHIFDMENRTASPLITNLSIQRGMEKNDSLEKGLRYFCDHYVLPEDRERYWVFADPDTMLQRIRQSPDGILCDYFRLVNPEAADGYVWKEFDLLLIPGTVETQVLSCIKSARVSQDFPVIVRALNEELNRSREVS